MSTYKWRNNYVAIAHIKTSAYFASIIETNRQPSLDKESKGEVFCAPLDVFLDQENAYQPDILFVSKERLNIIKEDGIYGIPDLIIEILSISNSYHDLKTKKNVYEKYGVKEYWIIDPMDKEAIGFQNKQNKFIEFFRGNGGFTLKLLNLEIKID